MIIKNNFSQRHSEVVIVSLIPIIGKLVSGCIQKYFFYYLHTWTVMEAALSNSDM